MQIATIMIKKPVSIGVNATIGEVLEKFHDSDIRHLPVVDNDNVLLGMVSDRDIRSYMLPADEEIERIEDAQKRRDATIGDIVQLSVLSLTPESEVTDAIELMIEERVGAIPIVDGSSGKLCAIVSYIDILHASKDFFATSD